MKSPALTRYVLSMVGLLPLFLLSAATTAEEAWVLEPPLGLDLYMPVPASNPLTQEKATLGRQLFFDKRLSLDRTLACASCHDPERAFSDGRALVIGINGAVGTRNAPAILNRGYGRSFLWDGRAASLEQQVLGPIFNPRELGLTRLELERRTELSAGEVAAALASYVRSIRAGDSRYDRYAAGKSGALSALEKTGLEVFLGKGRCISCHVGSNFTDEDFHNTGVAWRDSRLRDQGRFAVTGKPEDRGAFKTPTLREISQTAPYMHDGSLATLEEVVDFYSDGGRQNPYLDPEIGPRFFTSEEKTALVEFLHSLSGQIHEGG